jgi:uncharacterized protein YjbJ (UPF0337 family)
MAPGRPQTISSDDRQQQTEDDMADKDRIKGSAEQAKGSIKKGVGEMTGDEKMQAEGAADKAKGKVQNAAGSAKDAVRDTVGKDTGGKG